MTSTTSTRLGGGSSPALASPRPPLNGGRRFWVIEGARNFNDQWAREVFVHPDCKGGPHWLVEWGDTDGGCYVTVFDGPVAEQRARDYFEALKSGRLKVVREIE
jgi:hypothetical protein